MKTKCLLFSLLVLCASLVGARAANKPPTRPNIVIILCDDVGYGELGFQGNKEIPTPHIDSIAKNGIRFTQGYVSGRIAALLVLD